MGPKNEMPDSGPLAFEGVSVEQLASMAAPYNPRRISDHDLKALQNSMATFGVVEPVVVNRSTGRIVGGHQRVKAAEAEGMATLPVVYVDLDENQEKQLNLALNYCDVAVTRWEEFTGRKAERES